MGRQRTTQLIIKSFFGITAPQLGERALPTFGYTMKQKNSLYKQNRCRVIFTAFSVSELKKIRTTKKYIIYCYTMLNLILMILVEGQKMTIRLFSLKGFTSSIMIQVRRQCQRKTTSTSEPD
jgi:hypothetical protein